MWLKPTIIKDFFQSKSNLTLSVINLVDSNNDSELNTELIASTLTTICNTLCYTSKLLAKIFMPLLSHM